MAAHKHRRVKEATQGASDPRPQDMKERDLWSQIRARAGEVATLAEVYPTLAIEDGGRCRLQDLVAIIGEKCEQLRELIDATWKRPRRRS